MNEKILLLVLDGWGLSTSFAGNAIRLANAENFDYLWNSYPHWVLNVNKINNSNILIDSNIGSASISCGRFLPSNLDFINETIKDQSFFSNRALNDSIDRCLSLKSSLHLIGLISDSGKFSSLNHLFALLKMAKRKGLKEVFIHAICDGIDSEEKLTEVYINKINGLTEKEGIGKIASIAGRKYCFDEETSFENILKYFRAITSLYANQSLDVIQTIHNNRKQNRLDGEIYPTLIYENKHPIARIKDFDSLIFFNYDDKSLRSLASIFLGQRNAIRNKEVYNVNVTTFTDYLYLAENVKLNIAFSRDDFKPNLAQVLSENNKKQLYISDIKKSASSIYSFCGQKNMLPGQTNKIINSESNYHDLTLHIFNEIIESLKNDSYDFICANMSSADYFGHRGSISETENAVKNIDSHLLEIEETALQNKYNLLITADHGFVEQMASRNKENTSAGNHSTNPVPFIYIKKGIEKNTYNLGLKNNLLSEILNTTSSICDVAPTILDILKINALNSMVGKSLL